MPGAGPVHSAGNGNSVESTPIAPAAPPRIERLSQPPTAAELRDLADLLVSAVTAGAAVSFVLPLTHADAEAWWQRTLSSMAPRSAVLVARADSRIVGTVQLHAAWAPNQPHRADVAKLLVAPSHQRSGLGAALMQMLEAAAYEAEFSLLTLDAKAGGAAERLYRRLGWTSVGVIPRFARDPDGPLHDAIVMYKELPPRTFYHGTRAELRAGDLMEPGYRSNYTERRSPWIYFSETLNAAIWGAELAKGDGPGRIYIVEPTGPFVDDPNLTNQRFAGNPTKSYRSQQPLRVVGEVRDWTGHTPGEIEAMKAAIAGKEPLDD